MTRNSLRLAAAVVATVGLTAVVAAVATAHGPTRSLRVHLAGTGSGVVQGPGIACPSDCEETYNQGTHVSLEALSGPGSSFAGFSGECSGSACDLAMNIDRDVTATFVSHDFKLGDLRRDTRRGTAKLDVTLPGPGKLTVGGRGLRSKRAPRITAAKPVSGPGKVTLTLEPDGLAKRKLRRSGAVTIKAKITFAPDDGVPASKKRTVRLKRKR